MDSIPLPLIGKNLGSIESPLSFRSLARFEMANGRLGLALRRVTEGIQVGLDTPQNVDEYLAGVPEPACSTLDRVRAAIRSAVPPEATEAISYRIPAFKYRGPLVGSAGGGGVQERTQGL